MTLIKKIIGKMLLVILNGEEIVGTFYGKDLQKTNKTGLRVEKVIKRKGDDDMSNGEVI